MIVDYMPVKIETKPQLKVFIDPSRSRKPLVVLPNCTLNFAAIKEKTF